MSLFTYYDESETETLDPVFTKAVSDETRAKKSAALMGHDVSQRTRAVIGARYRGKKLSKEHRENMRKSKIGHKHSEETRAKIRESAKLREKAKAKFLWHTPAGVFSSSKEAAFAMGYKTGGVIRSRCDNKKFPNYFREILDK
jgi:hypothetical protein